jgi:hypothetical protein
MTRQTETDLVHGVADVEPGVRLHYVTAGEGHRTAVLFHGSFPRPGTPGMTLFRG